MTRSPLPMLAPILAFFALAACHSAGEQVPGDTNDRNPWNGIAAGEVVHFLGTEPFWGGQVGPDGLTYTTPENEKGETVAVNRFAGRGGVSFSGTLAGGAATLMVTPAPCGDGMSDARYPFIVTLQIAQKTRSGCGWTEKRPRTTGQ
ncbi:hypothetical protein V474_22375 [Novosphingobium barchaimii LL02]|uniref:Lipoprotein n=1 Tax=Novosphingobium barchaimii LL02 TaxID=1114963 RepID=A0A0J7XQX5_9SPHN|nr:hypothetical protein [Novosphingobium barchaimii]KMS53463.1 hypothetical protein V474_22375 [Novosphingobium barchaimii LL02]